MTTGAQGADIIASAPTQMNTTAVDNNPNLDTGVDISWPLPTNWGDNGSNPAGRGFRVYRDTTDISGLLPSSTLSFNDNGGLNNLSYTYHIDAVNGCGLTTSYTSMAAMDELMQKAWAHAYIGSGLDEAYDIKPTNDGNYIMAGYTRSFGSGGKDAWILKVNPAGTIISIWQKAYGAGYDEEARSIYQTSDGGYIVCGYTESPPAATRDIWIFKVNSLGDTILWQKHYGGSLNDSAYDCQQTSDGGYIVLGETRSFGAGNNDFLVLRLNSAGEIVWQKTYGGAGDEFVFPHSLQQTTDGGFIFTGATASFGTYRYAWIIKIDATGTITWQKTYGGGSLNYEGHSIQKTADGGYVVAGFVDNDFWIAKLTSDGTPTWQKRYGTASYYESARSITQTIDGGYIVTGETNSFGAGSYDYWILKLDSSLNIVWQKTYGGASEEYPRHIVQTGDAGYIVAGSTRSFPTNPTNYNYWILKLRSDGSIHSTCTFINSSNVSPVNTSVTAQNTSITAAAVSITAEDTYWSGVDSICTDTLVCKFAPAPGTVPDNDNYPGIPLKITKSGTNLILTWSAPGGYCDTEDYAIYRGTLPWSVYNHVFNTCSTGGATTRQIAADSGSYYYLIAAISAAREGSYGLDSSNAQRPAAATPCLAQEIGTCN